MTYFYKVYAETFLDLFLYYFFGKEELTDDVREMMCESDLFSGFIASIIICSISVKDNYQKIHMMSSEKTSSYSKILMTV
jgi:hypothetical protein